MQGSNNSIGAAFLNHYLTDTLTKLPNNDIFALIHEKDVIYLARMTTSIDSVRFSPILLLLLYSNF